MNLIDKTPAQEKLEEMQRLADAGLQTLRNSCVASFRLLWYSDTAAILAELGNKAAGAFQLHANTVAFLLANGAQIEPEDYTPPRAYTAHQDGTITLDV